MARRTARHKRLQRRTAAALVGLLLAAALAAAMYASRDFTSWLYRAVGITRAQVPAAGGSTSPVGVHIVDVGQGDAVLLEADGQFALIDAGPPEGADDLVAYLEAAGVDALRCVFVTHPHADHIGGMQAVVERFEVGPVIMPDPALSPVPASPVYEGLLEAMLRRGVPAEIARRGDEYRIGGGTVRVVHAGLASDDNHNLLSLGLLFSAPGISFLDTGDGERANERAMLESGEALAADIFMAGHHGSSTSNTPEFVLAVGPGSVVVSCGAGNGYGHPHRAALEAFGQAGALVLRTDQSGSVVLRPGDGGGIVYGTVR